MGSRMDKYKNEDLIPTRSDKNKTLYRQIYNAYDEFENLVVPSNAREINPSDLKKEITSRQEYRERREYDDITDRSTTNNKVIRKEKAIEEQKQENEIYDINELINKAVTERKGPELIEPTLANDNYLKKLKLDSHKTNIEQVKEIYEDIKEEEAREEDESLLKTANLSLEILSDLRSDNDATMVSAPIKNEELPEDSNEMDFYSSNYKFSKRDFEDKKYHNEDDDEEDEYEEKTGSGKLFLKILLLVFGILLIVGVLLYFIHYFNRV